MPDLQLASAPVGSTGMLVRRPTAEVFEAVVDPAVTTQVWLTTNGGRFPRGLEDY